MSTDRRLLGDLMPRATSQMVPMVGCVPLAINHTSICNVHAPITSHETLLVGVNLIEKVISLPKSPHTKRGPPSQNHGLSDIFFVNYLIKSLETRRGVQKSNISNAYELKTEGEMS